MKIIKPNEAGMGANYKNVVFRARFSCTVPSIIIIDMISQVTIWIHTLKSEMQHAHQKLVHNHSEILEIRDVSHDVNDDDPNPQMLDNEDHRVHRKMSQNVLCSSRKKFGSTKFLHFLRFL